MSASNDQHDQQIRMLQLQLQIEQLKQQRQNQSAVGATALNVGAPAQAAQVVEQNVPNCPVISQNRSSGSPL